MLPVIPHSAITVCLIYSTKFVFMVFICLQVMKHPVLNKQQSIIPAVARVLAWSQSYMRSRQVH